jgi:hypothetical protein
VPYLENPPAVIPIDVGRQLFVDDFLRQGRLHAFWVTPIPKAPATALWLPVDRSLKVRSTIKPKAFTASGAVLIFWGKNERKRDFLIPKLLISCPTSDQ